MKRDATGLRLVSTLLAIEPRMLFDGAAGAAAIEAVACDPLLAAPEIHAPSFAWGRAEQVLHFDLPHCFAAQEGRAPTVRVADLDDQGGTYRLTLEASSGVLSVVEVPGADVVGNGSRSISVSGSLGALNDALAGLALDRAEATEGNARLALSLGDPDGLGAWREIVVDVQAEGGAPQALDDRRVVDPGGGPVYGNVVRDGADGDRKSVV